MRARQLGASQADLLESYPLLRPGDLAHAWLYYDSHRDEIERQISDTRAPDDDDRDA